MIHQPIPRQRVGTKSISVEALLNWAFGSQQASLETKLEAGPAAFGTEWVIYQRGAVVGTAIDGGRGYLPDPVHEDAEIVAAVVKGALHWQVACWVADLARAGMRPDWLPGVSPRCIPKETHENQYGVASKSEIAVPGAWPNSWGSVIEHWEGRRRKKFEVRVCPIRYWPTQAWIDHQREAYRTWWAALHQIREHLILGNVLRDHAITLEMPPAEPWKSA